MKNMKKKIFLFFLVISMSLYSYSSDFNFYGFLKLTAAYDTGNSYPGNFVFFTKNPGLTENLLYITANESRVGMNIKGKKIGEFKLTGKVEIDFMGGNAENKAYMIMRHAYLKLESDNLTILAGQSWDIISPLNPVALNYSVMWMGGNIAYRRAQLRIEKRIKSGETTFLLQTGIFRTIGGDFDLNSIDDGVSSAMPTFQGRIAVISGIGGSIDFQIGVSAHYGKVKSYFEENNTKEFATDSINGDFLVKIGNKVKLIAEVFSGKNLGSFLGGIGQTVNLDKMTEIKSKGGFVNFVFSPSKSIMFSLGYGEDDPDNSTLSAGNRAKNSVAFGNVIFLVNKDLRFGFELQKWETDYYMLKSFSSTRFQFSAIYSF